MFQINDGQMGKPRPGFPRAVSAPLSTFTQAGSVTGKMTFPRSVQRSWQKVNSATHTIVSFLL